MTLDIWNQLTDEEKLIFIRSGKGIPPMGEHNSGLVLVGEPPKKKKESRQAQKQEAAAGAGSLLRPGGQSVPGQGETELPGRTHGDLRQACEPAKAGRVRELAKEEAMKCKQCPEGRRFARGSVECLLYGFIIREEHEGTREGCVEIERRIAAGSYADNPATELQEECWPDFDSLPGILSEA